MNDRIEILSTQNYGKFSFISGNRMIIKGHVKALIHSIETKNLLRYSPIIVNKKMEIIDGQHRFEAAKQLNIPIYYLVAKDVEFSDVMLLNSIVKKWKPADYMETYAERGLEDYVMLRAFAKEYRLSVSNAIAVLSIGSNPELKSPMTEFRAGTWQITDFKQAELFAKEYNEIAAFAEEKTAKDRDLMRAVYKMYYRLSDSIIHADFMEKLKQYPTPIYRRLNAKEYLRQFEDIYNTGSRRTLRFI